MTDRTIPAAPLALGLAGLIPFLWGTLTLYVLGLHAFGSATFGPRFVGPYVQVFYGAIILAFMSGVLWGFATRSAGREAGIGYGLSVLPALWAFFATGGGPLSAAWGLALGYAGLLGIETWFVRRKLAPAWWMRLRLTLSAVVISCLIATALA
ncbi:MAG: DUF3429 domain-containing protein [Pseudomonadota bacterium]|nr:DUF3429 domain-containing protein [Pseudomonadota bacterium]